MMKNLILAISVIIFMSFTISSDSSNNDNNNSKYKQSITDPNFFKHELQESVMEFITDTGMNPDSSYIPFKDEI